MTAGAVNGRGGWRIVGRAGVPVDLSMGSHEARELCDGGARYRGLGARGAVRNVNAVIAPALVGQDASRQRDVEGDKVARARSAGLDAEGSRRKHDSPTLLLATSDLVVTNPTGTDVND